VTKSIGRISELCFGLDWIGRQIHFASQAKI